MLISWTKGSWVNVDYRKRHRLGGTSLYFGCFGANEVRGPDVILKVMKFSLVFIARKCQLARVGWFDDVNGKSSRSHRQKPDNSRQYYPSWETIPVSLLLVSHSSRSKEMCQSHGSASSDDEYRSSRNIAISLFKRYRNVIDRGGGDNLKEFISAGVNAYALGCTDKGLRKEFNAMKESGIEIEAMQSYGGSTSLKSKICVEEVDECILWLSILFISILCTPQPTIVRWSSTPPVSDDVLHQWKGFCALISNAYYIRGMAWLPVKTLQPEQMAVVGRAEEPSVVASRMRLVLSTHESKFLSMIMDPKFNQLVIL
ncbi:uncharacterized protein LOC111280272 [Durio zibethinus]|uniref:Uncharacterized protein LOC111280272 n=1 Tax=Durio zibethinus TaxID=66656 RepID=A0A6P5X495_DURZI|nr:uncharacterized protein LOC111280272 [Durio zibethinus]